MNKPAQYFGKRMFDVVLASAMLLAALPLMLFAAAGILIASPGPILYHSRRVGMDGKPFYLHKLRSMTPAKSGTGSSITQLGDPRVYPFGEFLRRYKIDEFPQMINILKGDMSIVGPRPEDPGIVEKYYTEREWSTLKVRPGLTSPGAVYYYTDLERRLEGDGSEAAYAERILPEMLAVDLVYLERESLWYDIRVVFRTAKAIFLTILGQNVSLRPPELDHLDEDDFSPEKRVPANWKLPGAGCGLEPDFQPRERKSP